jgi:hypothetical protein
MDMAGFHKLRTAVQANARPAGDLDTLSMERVLFEVLSTSRLFSEVELGHTDDPDQLLIGVCQCAENVLPWEAAIGVERLWRRASMSTTWEAHAVACTEGFMEFEGAVSINDGAQYVTVHLVAESAPRHDEEPAARLGVEATVLPLRG